MVRQRGKKVKTPLFDLYYLSRKGDVSSRFGFVISTRLDKRSVKRNRVKRIFREEVRSVLPKVRRGFDFVFLVKREALEAGPNRVRRIVRGALKERGLLAND